MLYYVRMDENLEIETWSELKQELHREPTDDEFEDAFNRKLLNLEAVHYDNLEARATGN